MMPLCNKGLSCQKGHRQMENARWATQSERRQQWGQKQETQRGMQHTCSRFMLGLWRRSSSMTSMWPLWQALKRGVAPSCNSHTPASTRQSLVSYINGTQGFLTQWPTSYLFFKSGATAKLWSVFLTFIICIFEKDVIGGICNCTTLGGKQGENRAGELNKMIVCCIIDIT